MKYFDENIIALIDLLEYDMWLVLPDFHVKCVCQNFETKDGNKFCPYCLGTGYKVKIKKIKGVRQPDSLEGMYGKYKTEFGVYFFKNEYPVKEKAYIVWHDEIEEITHVERFCSDAQKPVYNRVETIPKKTGTETFLKIFHRLTDNAGK